MTSRTNLQPQWLYLLCSVLITLVQKGAARVFLSTARRHQLQLVEALLPSGGPWWHGGVQKWGSTMVYPQNIRTHHEFLWIYNAHLRGKIMMHQRMKGSVMRSKLCWMNFGDHNKYQHWSVSFGSGFQARSHPKLTSQLERPDLSGDSSQNHT